MSLIQCRECGQKISPQEKYCPHCGANPHKLFRDSEIRLGILLLITITALAVAAKTPLVRNIFAKNKSNTMGAFPVASLQVNYSQNYKPLPDRIAVTGEVKNINSFKLPNVEVIVRWFDKYGNLICTDTGQIQAQPLYAGRISSFEVISIYQEDMLDYQIAFRSGGGGDITTINKR